MGNGFKKYNFLVLFDTVSQQLVGQSKENSPFDPDYIAPIFDPISCPFPTTTTTTTTETPTTTTTTTTTVPTTTATPTTTTTTINYSTGSLLLNNNTGSPFVCQLFSSIAAEDRLGEILVTASSSGGFAYQRDVANGSASFLIDLINNGTSLINIHIVILINGNQVYVGDSSGLGVFDWTLGMQQTPVIVVTIS